MPRAGSGAISANSSPVQAQVVGTPTAIRGTSWRENLTGIITWAFSGTTLTAAFLPVQTWLLIALALQVLICVRPGMKLYGRRAGPIALVAALYACWATVASVSHGITGELPDQITGLLGVLVRLAIVLVPLLTLPRPKHGLIEAMAWICSLAIFIFFMRQIGLVAGFDISNLFNWFYPFTGISPDRTIFIFNFDIPDEVTRNSGPFGEPGMFAANIVIAALLLLSQGEEYTKRMFRRRVALFGTALLSSQSTMGLATVPLLAFLSLRPLIPRWTTRLLVSFPMGLAVLGLAAVLGTAHEDKLLGQVSATEKRESSWFNTRFGNAEIDFDAITGRPFLGYGFTERGRPINFMVYRDNRWRPYQDGDELGLGNGLTGTAVKHGVVFAIILYLIFLWRLTRLYHRKSSGLIAWVTLGLLLFSQQLLLLPAAYCLLGSYSFASERRRRAGQMTEGVLKLR
jgi:hypothetical protein